MLTCETLAAGRWTTLTGGDREPPEPADSDRGASPPANSDRGPSPQADGDRTASQPANSDRGPSPQADGDRRASPPANRDREPSQRADDDRLVWLVGDSLSAEEFELVRRWLAAADVPSPLADRLLTQPRAHLERRDNLVALVLDTMTVNDDDGLATGHIVCVVSARLIVTVSPAADPGLAQLAEEIRAQAHTQAEAAIAVLTQLVTQVLADAEDVEEKLSAAINDVEQAMFTTQVDDPVERIYSLKRQVSKADYVVGALSRPLERLVQDEAPPFADRPARAKLHRLAEWSNRLARMFEADDRMLGDMLQVHLSQVSVRQNEDMRKISAWAGLIAVPTLITGVYGMNFEVIPWLSAPWGFGAVMGLTAAVCVVLYRVFKRSGWL